MIFSRHSFFLLLLSVLVFPLFAYKLIWLSTSRETTGYMYFLGHGNLGSVFGISTYPVIRFGLGKDTILFNGNVNINLKTDEAVSVRYQKNDPSDAKINVFECIWGDTFAYCLAPFLFLLVIYFHPDLLPKKARIEIGRRPFIRILPGNKK